MKDPLDRATLDLLGPRPGGQKSVAQRQAEYVERMAQRGFKRNTFWLHQKSRQAGFDAARDGRPHRAPKADNELDRFSWLVGYAEFLTQERQ